MFHITGMPLDLEASLLFSESVWALIHLHHGDTLQIFRIYGSSSSADSNNDNLMRLTLEASSSQDSHHVIIGDFNIPEINWKKLLLKKKCAPC